MKLKKIFNSFYKDIISDDNMTRYRSLFNIIATKYFVSDTDKIEKEYIIFNKVILRRVDEKAKRHWSGIFGFSLTEDLCKIFKNNYYKYYKNSDDIYLFLINSGEVFLFLKYVLHELIKKRKSHSPIIFTNKKYHQDLVKLFYPEIPCIYIRKIKTPFQKTGFKIFGYNFTLLVPKWHFDNVESGAVENKLGFENYFYPILDLYGCDKNNIKSIDAKLPHEIEQSMLNKIKKTGLNLNNFVFLAPEAESCKELSGKFWIELIKRLENKGFDVFVNIVRNRINFEDSKFKNTFLSYAEVFALCKYAKRIIALRSGICELLSETKTPMDILYTDFRKKPFFRDVNCRQVMKSFGFHNLVGINSDINEYDATGDFENIYEKLGVG